MEKTAKTVNDDYDIGVKVSAQEIYAHQFIKR
jgi:hypothetical protein